jgi:hypothetical protein
VNYRVVSEMFGGMAHSIALESHFPGNEFITIQGTAINTTLVDCRRKHDNGTD